MMLFIALILAGVAVCVALWAMGEPWVAHGRPRPAAASRPWWWAWVLAAAPWCTPWVTWRMRQRFSIWAARVDSLSGWQAEHWLAARLLSAMIAGALGAMLGVTQAWPVAGTLMCALTFAVCGYGWPAQALRRKSAEQRLRMMRELPFMLDLLTLCVEAGLSLPAALDEVARHAPDGPLCRSLRDAAALGRTGMARAQWLQQWAVGTDVPGVRQLVLTLAQADRLGMSLGPLLRAQAAQQRSERFLRAEKLALEAPVKMLFPMVLCIFPCTFVVIAFPVVVKLLDAGF